MRARFLVAESQVEELLVKKKLPLAIMLKAYFVLYRYLLDHYSKKLKQS